MRVIFLGTAHGLPEPNRKFSCIMIEVGENRYFVDMGCNAAEEMATRGVSFDSIKAIFITHMHSDHTSGLLPFVDLCNWYYKDANPKYYLPEPLEKSVDAIANWITLNGSVPIREHNFNAVREGVFYDDGVIKVTAYKTLHSDMSYAYLVEAEGKRLFFSGDLTNKGPEKDFPVEVLENEIDLAVLEAAHFPATAYLPIIRESNTIKKLLFTHYSPTFTKSAYEAKEQLSNIDCDFAYDGTEVQI
ncbi:MAG: ribonuclease Z [Clostridia bacterium]|nr:ribonuclease Z [Clostridia bacterium]